MVEITKMTNGAVIGTTKEMNSYYDSAPKYQFPATAAQPKILDHVERSRSLFQKCRLELGQNADKVLRGCQNLDSFRRFINAQRLRDMPDEGSIWDNSLRWALQFGERLEIFAHQASVFFPGSKQISENILGCCKALLLVGSRNVYALQRFFDELWGIADTLEVFEPHRDVYASSTDLQLIMAAIYWNIIELVVCVTICYLGHSITPDTITECENHITFIMKVFVVNKEAFQQAVWLYRLRASPIVQGAGPVSITELKVWLRHGVVEPPWPTICEGTCTWFERTLSYFKSSDDQLLGIFGKRGCDSSTQSGSSPVTMLKSLLLQLLDKNLGNVSFFKRIADIYITTTSKRGSIAERELEAALWEVFADCARMPKRINMVIDGLDHINGGSKKAEEVVSRIRGIIDMANKNSVKCIFTCTPFETPIPVKFTALTIDEANIRYDIKIYVSKTLSEFLGASNVATKERQNIVDLLSTKADGSFLLANLLIQTVKRGRNLAEILKILGNSGSSGLAGLLDALQATADFGNPDTMRIISWLLVCEEPLSVLNVRELLEINCSTEQPPIRAPRFKWDIEKDIIQQCGSLVVVDRNIVRFAHPAIKEHFWNSTHKDKRLPSPRDCHSEVLLSLLGYIATAEIPNSAGSGFKPVSTELVQSALQQYGLMSYCIRNWLFHFRESSFYRERKITTSPALISTFPSSQLFPQFEYALWVTDKAPEADFLLASQIRQTILMNVPSTIQSLINLANIRVALGQPAAALQVCYEAWKLSQTLFGNYSRQSFEISLLFSSMSKQQVEVEAGTEIYDWMISYYQSQQLDLTDEIIDIVKRLGSYLSRKGKSEEAMTHYRWLWGICRQKGGETDTRSSEILDLMATVAEKTPSSTEYLDICVSQFKVTETKLKPWDKQRTRAAIRLALAYDSCGKFSNVSETFDAAIKSLTSSLSSCRSEEVIIIHEERVHLIVEFATFYSRKSRRDNAVLLIKQFWGKFRQDVRNIRTHTVGFIERLLALGEIMESLDLLDEAEDLYASLWSYFKQSSELMITDFAFKVGSKLAKLRKKSHRSPKEEEEVLKGLVSILNSSTIKELTSIGLDSFIQLSQFYEDSGDWTQATDVSRQGLERLWPNLLSNTDLKGLTLPQKFIEKGIKLTYQLALSLSKKGDINQACNLYRLVFVACQNTIIPNTAPRVVTAFQKYCSFCYSHGRTTEAIDACERYFEALAKNPGPSNASTVDIGIELAGMYLKAKRRTDAITIYKRLYSALILTTFSFRTLAVAAALSVIYEQEPAHVPERLEFYASFWDKLMSSSQLDFTPDSALVFKMYQIYRSHIEKSGRERANSDITKITQQLLVHYRERTGEKNPFYFKVLLSYAQLLEQDKSKSKDAIREYEKLLELALRAGGTTENTANILLIQQNLARLYMLDKSTETKAGELYKSLWEEFRVTYGLGNHLALGALRRLAQFYCNQNDSAAATTLLQNTIIGILSTETNERVMFDSAVAIAKMFILLKIADVGTSFVRQLRKYCLMSQAERQAFDAKDPRFSKLVFRNFNNLMTERRYQVFFSAFETVLRKGGNIEEEDLYTVVIGAVLQESEFYMAWLGASKFGERLDIILASGARLRAFLKAQGREEEFKFVENDLWAIFKREFKTFGPDTRKTGIELKFSEEMLQEFFKECLDLFGNLDQKESVSLVDVGLKRIEATIQEGDIDAAFILAVWTHKCMTEENKLGNVFRLLFLMTSEKVKSNPNEILRNDITKFSQLILQDILATQGGVGISWVSVDLKDLHRLLALLGSEGRWDFMLTILEQLWDCRNSYDHIWSPHLVTTIGRRLCDVYMKLGMKEEALRLAERIYYNYGRVFGLLHPETQILCTALSKIYISCGYYPKSIALSERLLRTLADPTTRGVLSKEQATGVIFNQLSFLKYSHEKKGGWVNPDAMVPLIKELESVYWMKSSQWNELADFKAWSGKSLPKDETPFNWQPPLIWGIMDDGPVRGSPTTASRDGDEDAPPPFSPKEQEYFDFSRSSFASLRLVSPGTAIKQTSRPLDFSSFVTRFLATMEQSEVLPIAYEAVFNHIVLPSQLPTKEDNDVDAIATDLLQLATMAVRDLRDIVYDRYYPQLSLVYQSLANYKMVCVNGVLIKQVLLQQLRGLELKEQLILHITKQNAAILVRREVGPNGDAVTFEAFEASPTSQKALEAESALAWDFPGIAVSVPYSTFSQTSFQDELVTFLEQASKESIKRFAATTAKAASGAWESRDTVDPSLITSLFMTILEAAGTRIFPAPLQKRVRDEVSWSDGVNPWRRNPIWLILRVAIHKHLQLLLGAEAGTIQYKFLKCWLLEGFLRGVFQVTHAERTTILKAKLCRRMAKLEFEKSNAPERLRITYQYFIDKLSDKIKASVALVDDNIADIWQQYCKRMERRVVPLPRRAEPNDTSLSLPNSSAYLFNILNSPQMNFKMTQTANGSYRRSEIPKDGRKDFAIFADQYYKLFSTEENLRYIENSYRHTADPSEEKCVRLSRQLNKYLDSLAGLCQGMSGPFSEAVLNVMDLWIAIDGYAVQRFPLLAEFHPLFTPEILNALHIENARDFERLQRIGEHLKMRVQGSVDYTSIFADPCKGCFADRYVEHSQDSAKFKELYKQIEATAEAGRLRKEAEWREKSAEYEALNQQILVTACQYFLSNEQPPVQYHDDRNCTKCYLERKARRVKITAHEHPLPADVAHARAVIFELRCPSAFSIYRDVTWRILSTLALPSIRPAAEPRLVLQSYSELSTFGQRQSSGVTLASTKKSFLQTHLANVTMPTTLEKVCLPNGLSLSYYDSDRKCWPGRIPLHPTFNHHFPLPIPDNSPFISLRIDLDHVHPPTSYEIVASQTRCPAGVNVHEFLAYQGLLMGYNRRLPSILIEMASSNLNFSSETTTLLVKYLIHQAGPSFPTEPLRVVYKIFQDDGFSSQLLNQINARLQLISSNWREVYCMDLLITFLTRAIDIWSLSPTTALHHLDHALGILQRVRTMIKGWLCNLRKEIDRAETTDSSRRFSEFTLWAALLGKLTFSPHSQHPSLYPLDELQLEFFIECSIMLQHSLVAKPLLLPLNLRHALIRDLRVVYNIRDLLRTTITKHSRALSSALAVAWPQEEDAEYLPLEILPAPNDWWVQMGIAASATKKPQTVLFHLLEGHLLIDGKPLGQLPPEHRNNPVLCTLFGNQNLLTIPSRLPGMTYMISRESDKHRVHLGFRNARLIVRAETSGTLIEYIPQNVFRNDKGVEDLPASLLDGCFHWLDLKRGTLHVRQSCWRSKPSDWTINLHTREAHRRQVKLIDRFSPVFKKIAIIFSKFEEDRFLTAFQPQSRALSVEMRRLELRWEVNNNGLLESEALHSYIDKDQDAGTWYGLRSKIVLRDKYNSRSRSIIIPLGRLRSRLNGPHVEVDIVNEGVYGRYQINSILGRIDCPPEPRLLYTKALVHAYTSFVIPDHLTGRTGTEESLHCLKSGYCQPWSPLNPRHYILLENLANLTPLREYYPVELKVMQKVTWDPHLRSHAQNDHFFFCVQEIIAKSEQLKPFSKERIEPLVLARENRELYTRSQRRRGLYERNTSISSPKAPQDLDYSSRGRPRPHIGRRNAYEAVHLLDNWAQTLPLPSDLGGVLEKWSTIGGFDVVLDKVLLSDRLSLDLPLFWGSLVRLCQASDQTQKYKLMFLLATLTYNSDVDMDSIRTLISFATNLALKTLPLPTGPSFNNFHRISTIKPENLKMLLKPYCKVYVKSDIQTAIGFTLSPKLRRKLEAEETSFNRSVKNECHRLLDHLLQQWPCLQPLIVLPFNSDLIDISQVLPVIQPEWSRLYFNFQLSNHVREVQNVLDLFNLQSEVPKPTENIAAKIDGEKKISRLGSQSLGDLLKAEGPSVAEKLLTGFLLSKRNTAAASCKRDLAHPQKPFTHAKEIRELENIIQDIARTDSIVRTRYAQDLELSVAAFKKVSSTMISQSNMLVPLNIGAKIEEARQRVAVVVDRIHRALEGEQCYMAWLKIGDLLPRTTIVALLETLRSCNKISFGQNMREALILLGVSVTDVQKLLRVEGYRLRNDTQRTAEEESNVGHQNWNPSDYPDWLLLEIDSNILIRPDQLEVAHATIRPASGNNSVLQMNMGQGKSSSPINSMYDSIAHFLLGKTSCIMPMVAAILADGKRLLRVVVPRALLLQTVQIIHARLGGLVGREVRHVPFSRQTATTTDVIRTFHEIHSKILKCSGLMITLPEHTLSFMLSGLQRLSDGRLEEAKPMVRIQSWLDKLSRDILDESDFTLAVRTQLIYPSGSQKAFDGHPHRWKTVEALLALVHSYLANLQAMYPRSLEVVERAGGGYPFTYFLRRDAEEALVKRLVNDICSGRTTILPLADATALVQRIVKHFITDARVSPEQVNEVRQSFEGNMTVLKTIYLLRGLFVHRILLLALKKRWNVQYGLHPTRDPVAVPYHAKGVPSEQAEWGHPDVAILFTCLSFYYHGLNMEQLCQSLRFVLQSDDPASEYDRWTYSSETLPGSLREWNSINVDDEVQLMEIWGHVRYNVVVIDHYLNNFVFPRHAKQFLTKLQASGWDIPLFSNNTLTLSKNGKPLTTGFSGTNDNKTMLPLTITQEDLPTLSHTNAEVLTYLLQPRNRSYVLAANLQGRRWTERTLLKNLAKMNIRILIDAGAQILEMDNRELVAMWMEIDTIAPAAIYFDKTNKPFVRYRNGSEVPLLATPYAEGSRDCLIYLDESHTRGTDLKMPNKARGALTLGLGQTKDHTVQAAMRLRQLGTTQSVVFFAPPEVHQSIVDTQQKQFREEVDSRDVITWLLHQTCAGIEQLQPLYFSQGMDFCRRVQATSDNPEFLDDPVQLKTYLNTLKQSEQQTLRQMYEPRQNQQKGANIESPSTEIARFMDELKIRRRGFQDTGEAVHGSALQEVEQEREVAFEVESVREVQKPVHFTPFKFPGLHKDLLTFLHSGRLLVGAGGYEPAFSALRRICTLGEKYHVDYNATSGYLYVSTEFTKTVRTYSSKFDDNFLRPVNWLLVSTEANIAIIVTPEETEHLIPHLNNKSRHPAVYLLAYAAPVTRKMVPFDTLRFLTTPTMEIEWKPPEKLSVELGIFAGRLYFTYDHVSVLQAYLQLDSSDLEPGEISAGSIFTSRPLSFLQEWLTLKRKGQDFLHTPMGHLCQSKELLPTHPFFQGDAGGVLKANSAAGEEGASEGDPTESESVRDGESSGEDL
ncbi:hypothetical protein Dda_9302 [Drechslerella dactyloides]|uniref:ubiquitinyl hydrolase 1 n=1 Tax=Drechslerella dactyloides TaxID=74499 RepID=A0AAD6IPH8_DREDA|nr:hypothetical protein Dda_9302 [Drechslerella dactyloides]